MDQPEQHSTPRAPSLPPWRTKDAAGFMGEEDERDAPAIKTLRRLQVVTDAALSHLSLAELERDLLDRIRHLLCGDIAMILLLTEDGQHLAMSASSGIAGGFEEQGDREILIPVGRGLAGLIAAQRKPLIFDDLSEVEVLNPVLLEKGIRSLVGAPLLIEGRVLGVIYVGTTRRHRFSDEDARLLLLVGDRFALAIERIRLDEAAREEEQRKGAILEAALDCIILMDHEGLITEFNPAAQRTFGYSRAEAVGRSLADLLIPPALRERHHQGLARYLETGQGAMLNKRIEITAMRADGSEFPVELTIVALNLRGRPFFTGYVRDITERRRAEAEHEHMLAREQTARAEAEAANQAKDQFLSTLSHELRTPLTPMLGWSQMLLTRKLDEAMTREAHAAIMRSVKAQMRLVDDLLDVSRIITGKLTLNPCPLDLEPLVTETINMVRPLADAQGIVLRTVLDSGAGALVGDPDRLRQIVWNLLSNAIKFTPAGGRVELRLERHDGRVRLQVSDTGEGISAEFLPQVFDRLRQADSSITRPHGGLGLGLAIVRHLVELHGGSVRAESPGQGQGATFTVELPAAEAPPATEAGEESPTEAAQTPADEEAANRAASSGSSGRLRDLKILVVDDSSEVRHLIGAMLKSSGASVSAAASADEALAALKQWRPDILVSDIAMPGEDGYTFMRKVRALAPSEGGETPAVALTAFAGAEERGHALAAGYQTHLAKPINAAQLVATIASLTLPAEPFSAN